VSEQGVPLSFADANHLSRLIEIMHECTRRLDGEMDLDRRRVLWDRYEDAYKAAMTILPPRPEPI